MRIVFAPAGMLVSDRHPHGEATIAYNVLSRLGRRGHDVVGYTETAASQVPGVELREVSGRSRGAVFSRLAFARRVARDLASRAEHFDIVHALRPINVASGYTLADSAPLVVGPLTLPWDVNDRGAAPRNRFASSVAGGAVTPIERRLHRQTLERASVILVTGRPAFDALPSRLHERCVEVPLGVDTSRFTASPLPDEPTILFLSVMLPRKGYEVLLRALPPVATRIPRVRLVIAGDDPRGLVQGAKKLADQLGVGDRVEFAGPVAPKDAPAFYRRARVFCQPSLGEPFGLAILEAMASARPIVATRAGGVPGFVSDGTNGVIVEPGSSESLAAALIRVLERTAESKQMAEANRDAAVKRFDWERVVDRIEESYERAKGVTGERRAV